jgi:predicted nucleotidyltransferase
MLQKYIEIAKSLLKDKFPEADCAFLSGSIMRGEGLKHSDLDIVVLYQKIPNAYRESILYHDTPIELFVHDPETIHWFIDDEKKNGLDILAHMITTGIIVPKPTALSEQIINYSNSILKLGPDPITNEDLAKLRYYITDMIDDLRDDRPQEEKIAIAVRFYPLLAEAALRGSGQCHAYGKWIPRKLKMLDVPRAERFNSAFQSLFVEGNASKLIALAEEILKPMGGFYWHGYRHNAPKKWRKKFV